ncbi:hypothetical protein CVT24_006134 [Panaeolus cyanescens]|uniref:HAT C-terminal dimerisation domain-containing protein n=1 Tax=Panaeolus cyanescens TaxID=181874 RepID=A0A409X512_9AGAR|nr:hypothetical protein CVT24_006134 [Panaeolus cyanescens]
MPRDSQNDDDDDDDVPDLVSEEDEDEDEDDEDDGEGKEKEEMSEDAVTGLVELEGTLETKLADVRKNAAPIRKALTKVRVFAIKVNKKTTTATPAWKASVKKLAATPEGKDAGITERTIPRDVATRWNSSLDMIEFACRYRAAIDEVTSQRDLGLRDYELDNQEWDILAELGEYLKIFKTATLAFSRDAPSLPSETNKSAELSELDEFVGDWADDKPASNLDDELDRYLSEKRVAGVRKPMKWWHSQKSAYPRLFRMARDFLHIPATSVPVERVFSRGRLTLAFI